MEVFGQKPLAIRLLSVVLSIAVMIVLFRFASILLDRNTALAAVALYALSPIQVHYGQEARMYVMLTLLLLIATWGMWRLLEDGGWIDWLILGISSALAVYTQALAVIYLICLFLIPFYLRRWDRILAVFFGGLIALIVYTPWLIQLPGQINLIQNSYWIQRPGVVELIQTVIAFNAGLPLVGPWLPVGLGLSVLLLALLTWQSVVSLKNRHAHSHKIGAILLLALGPIVLLFLISQLWPVYVIRGLLPSAVLYLVWIGSIVALDSIKRLDRGVIAAIVMALFSVGLLNHYQYQDFPYAPYQDINEYISENLAEDGIIVHSNKITMLPAYYYDQSLPHVFIADQPESGSDTLTIPTQEVIGIEEQADIESAVDGHKHVFLVIFEREIREYQQAGVEIHPNLNYLRANLKEQSLGSFGGVLVYEFQDLSD
jgi:4-amino-4-deoxy-L-arabinose transferase-like glycosyltransferase